MDSQIICFEDITAINNQRFYKAFLSRLKAQNIIVKQIDILSLIKDAENIILNNYNFQSKEFYFTYLKAIYLFLSTLEHNTCYIIRHTPLMYKLFKYISKQPNQLDNAAKNILKNFAALLQDILVFVNISSYTDSVKNILQDKISYKKYIYDKMISDYSNNTQKIDAIEKMKQLMQQIIVQFRKNNITSIKINLNFNEDINSGIQKIFKTLNID